MAFIYSFIALAIYVTIVFLATEFSSKSKGENDQKESESIDTSGIEIKETPELTGATQEELKKQLIGIYQALKDQSNPSTVVTQSSTSILDEISDNADQMLIDSGDNQQVDISIAPLDDEPELDSDQKIDPMPELAEMPEQDTSQNQDNQEDEGDFLADIKIDY